MNIFTEQRMGTPITEDERFAISTELNNLEALYHDEAWIAKEVAACTDLMGSWDRDLVLLCLEYDINMLRRTLETGIVTEH